MADISDVSNFFIKHYTEFSSENSLMTMLISDEDRVLFMLYLAKVSYRSVATGVSRFHPNVITYYPLIYPDETLDDTELTEFFKLINNMKNVHQLFKASQIRGRETTDNELIRGVSQNNPLGLKYMKLVYFFVFSNNIIFSRILLNNIDRSTTRIYKIKHETEKEESFHRIPIDSKILMHGTNIKNLYSIMRNGLKTMSKSKYQTNGAAYGDGIYLTDDVRLASYYSNTGVEEDNTVCILFFNVKNLKQKTHNIYVQDEDDIILRCILYIKKDTGVMVDDLVKYTREYAKKITYTPLVTHEIVPIAEVPENQNFLRMVDTTNQPRNDPACINKRFFKEIDLINQAVQNPDNHTFIASNYAEPDNPLSPLLILTMPDKDTPLYADLKRYNIPGVLFAVYLTNMYPLKPPKLRIISPIFAVGTGRVTEGGSMCLDQLYDAWSPATNINSLVISAVVTMGTDQGSSRGVGRVDPTRLDQHYKYEDYVQSYDMIGIVHGNFSQG